MFVFEFIAILLSLTKLKKKTVIYLAHLHQFDFVFTTLVATYNTILAETLHEPILDCASLVGANSLIVLVLSAPTLDCTSVVRVNMTCFMYASKTSLL